MIYEDSRIPNIQVKHYVEEYIFDQAKKLP